MAYETNFETNQRPALSPDESIYWQGKPKKNPFVLSRSLTLLPIAIIWLIIDSGVIIGSLQSGEMLWFIIPFFALHLMPVWIWLANTLTANKRWKNTTYYITNRRIIIQSGFFAVNETSLYYKDIRNVQLNIGLLNKVFKTGNIVFDTDIYPAMRSRRRHDSMHFVFENLEEPQQVYSKTQRMIMDIQTDMMYPNAYRPSENPGYNTDYDY